MRKYVYNRIKKGDGNMNNEFLKKYAELAVKIGVNIQEKQTLVINSPVECAEFTGLVTEYAYKAGAKEVFVNWNDEICNKLTYLHADESIFDTVPQWLVDRQLSFVHDGAAFLSISASDPELLKDVNQERIAKKNKNSSIALKEFNEKLMANENSWSVISIPTKAWATKVFKNESSEEAVEKLWDAIFKIVRVDKENPVEAWNQHIANLAKKTSYLNDKKFKKLHYTNSLGTDLWIELPKDHIWAGGADNVQGTDVKFIANMPTEEIFTLPDKNGVNGIVYSALPLNYGGNLVTNFSMTFKDGKVVDCTAETGIETLKHILDTDEGSRRLGEVALVPYDSPISNSKIIFFNTLFDENASCHLALGKAYPSCIKNGENMSDEELSNHGVNDSLNHVDFMVGTKDLNITGITENGEEIQIVKEGNWAF